MLRTLIGTVFLAICAPAWAADLPPSLASVVDGAAAQDLPVAPLEAKAVEGLAKGVPEARIAAVLDSLVGDLAHSRDVLGDAEDDVLYAGARAVKAGASDGALRALATGPVQDRALHSLADLLALGVSETDAVRVVRSAASTPVAAQAVAGLASSTAALVARGSTPNEAAVQAMSGLAGQTSGVGSLPDGAPGKDNPGKAYGHTKDGKAKAPNGNGNQGGNQGGNAQRGGGK